MGPSEPKAKPFPLVHAVSCGPCQASGRSTFVSFHYQQESGRKTEIMAEFLWRKFNISIYVKQKKKPGEKNYRKQLSPPGKRLGYQSLGAWRGPWNWSLDTAGGHWEGYLALWVLLSWHGGAGSGVMSPKSGLWAPPQYIV